MDGLFLLLILAFVLILIFIDPLALPMIKPDQIINFSNGLSSGESMDDLLFLVVMLLLIVLLGIAAYFLQEKK